MKPGFYDRYKPPRLDARVTEARVMLSMRGTVDGLAASTLAASFNLRPATADAIIAEEVARRAAA